MAARLQPIIFREGSAPGFLVDPVPRRARNRALQKSRQSYPNKEEAAEETVEQKLQKVKDSLESAFMRGDLEQVKTLLPKLYLLGGTVDGLDVLARCKGIQLHRTSLLHCCCEQGSVSILDWMLSYAPEADVDTLDGAEHTPLHRACEEGHAGICEVLLRHGADVNARTPASLLTPLHLTSMQTNAGLPPFGRGYLRVAQTLLKNGADPDLKDARGRNVIKVASTSVMHLALAQTPWSPSTHRIFPSAFRSAVRLLLLAAHALPQPGIYPAGFESLSPDEVYMIITYMAHPLGAWIEDESQGSQSKPPSAMPRKTQPQPLKLPTCARSPRPALPVGHLAPLSAPLRTSAQDQSEVTSNSGSFDPRAWISTPPTPVSQVTRTGL